MCVLVCVYWCVYWCVCVCTGVCSGAQTLPARVPSQIRYTDESVEQRNYVLRHLECSASEGTYFNHAILSTQDVRVAVKASACFGIDDTYLQ